jgi:hypothetical protein
MRIFLSRQLDLLAHRLQYAAWWLRTPKWQRRAAQLPPGIIEIIISGAVLPIDESAARRIAKEINS